MAKRSRQFEPVEKPKIKTGDKVLVISGNYKGQEGKVKRVIKDQNRVVVEEINMVTKHKKPTQQNPQGGGIVEVEAPIHMSNVMLVDPKSGEPTRVGRKLDEKGKMQRYSKKTGEIIK